MVMITIAAQACQAELCLALAGWDGEMLPVAVPRWNFGAQGHMHLVSCVL